MLGFAGMTEVRMVVLEPYPPLPPPVLAALSVRPGGGGVIAPGAIVAIRGTAPSIRLWRGSAGA